MRQEEDRPPVGKVALVALAALIVFAAGIGWALAILRARTAAIGTASPPAEVGLPEIGVVNQRPFDVDRRADELREVKLRRLGSYGWVDRDAGLIHVPVERAIDEVAE